MKDSAFLLIQYTLLASCLLYGDNVFWIAFQCWMCLISTYSCLLQIRHRAIFLQEMAMLEMFEASMRLSKIRKFNWKKEGF